MQMQIHRNFFCSLALSLVKWRKLKTIKMSANNYAWQQLDKSDGILLPNPPLKRTQPRESQATRRCLRKKMLIMRHFSQSARFSPVNECFLARSLYLSLSLFFCLVLSVWVRWPENESTLSKRIYVARPGDASAFALDLDVFFFSPTSTSTELGF